MNIDQKNLKITALLAVAAFFLTQDIRITLMLAAVNVAGGFFF